MWCQCSVYGWVCMWIWTRVCECGHVYVNEYGCVGVRISDCVGWAEVVPGPNPPRCEGEGELAPSRRHRRIGRASASCSHRHRPCHCPGPCQCRMVHTDMAGLLFFGFHFLNNFCTFRIRSILVLRINARRAFCSMHRSAVAYRTMPTSGLRRWSRWGGHIECSTAPPLLLGICSNRSPKKEEKIWEVVVVSTCVMSEVWSNELWQKYYITNVTYVVGVVFQVFLEGFWRWRNGVGGSSVLVHLRIKDLIINYMKGEGL